MTFDVAPLRETEADQLAAPAGDAGLGALRTSEGNLPLDRIDVRADITGLTSRVELTQDFVNTFDVPLEASYVFPLPDRGAVTSMRMTAAGRVVAAAARQPRVSAHPHMSSAATYNSSAAAPKPGARMSNRTEYMARYLTWFVTDS